MQNSFDKSQIDAKILEKEKQYIQDISEKISKATIDLIEDESEDFFENMDNASSKVQSLSTSLSSLDSTVEKLRAFDFFKQAESITSAEEKLSKSIGETQKVFDSYANSNAQFQSNMEKDIQSWQTINANLTEESNRIVENCKLLEDSISKFNKLMADVNNTIEKLNNQLEKNSTEKIETQIVEIQKDNEQSAAQLAKILKNIPVTLASLGIGAVIIIIQVVSIFIK